MQEMQSERSGSSQGDMILPNDFQKPGSIVRHGSFFSSINEYKKYVFTYQINAGTNNETSTWSMFLKQGKQSVIIWQFHKFSEELQQIILSDQEDPQTKSCWVTLGEYLEMIGKNTADFVFEEAEQMKSFFSKEDSGEFSEEEKVLFEKWWIDNFRQ